MWRAFQIWCCAFSTLYIHSTTDTLLFGVMYPVLVCVHMFVGVVYRHLQMDWMPVVSKGRLAVSVLCTHSLLLMAAFAVLVSACSLSHCRSAHVVPPSPLPSPPICCVRYARAARPCPDPTVSCYPSHKHFGAVPERLLAEVNSFIGDSRNFSNSTATTAWTPAVSC